MTPAPQTLYALLPDHARGRDGEAGYPLRALLAVMDEQLHAIGRDIDRQYADWFIETCADWVVPYIGDLVGYRPVAAAGLSADRGTPRLNAVLTPRAEVANTLAFRRRKGTVALLDELARRVTGWPSRVVEGYTLLSRTQHIDHVRADRGRSVDLRDGAALARLGTPFDTLAHGIDVRGHGRNVPDVVAFAWRLKTRGVTHAPACCVESEGTQCYTFSVLGNDGPLYAAALPGHGPGDAPGDTPEAGLPVRIRRDMFARRVSQHPLTVEANPALYGAVRSVAIYAPGWPDRDAPQPVPAARIVPANLTGWRHRAPRGKLLVDPETGRIVFPVRQPPKQGVWVDYHTAFPADIGGGEYHRPLARPADYTLYRVSRERPGDGVSASINAALQAWRDDPAHPRAAVIEILDSAAYSEPLAITLEAGQYLQVRAADRTRPVIRLLDYMADASDAFTVAGKRGSRLVLDGLLIAGRGLRVAGPSREDEERFAAGDLCDVTIRHCTLVPGWGLTCDCDPRRPGEPSLELVDCTARIRIQWSIIGAIEVTADETAADPVAITIEDSIVDATGTARAALRASNLPLAFATASFLRCTVFGGAQLHAIALAENSIFTGAVRVARRQTGCMRYCYVPPGSRTPRRSHCQPDPARADAATLVPHFTSVRYGNAAYAQLSTWCAAEIRRGADDESEPGVFHDLFQPQREANLRQRLAEYSPASTDTDVVFAN